MGIWQEYKDRGVVVWGIGSEDSLEILTSFREQMGLTFPILFDDGAAVQSQYNPGSVPTNSVYPQDWIINANGEIVYQNNGFEMDTMQTIIENLLQ